MESIFYFLVYLFFFLNLIVLYYICIMSLRGYCCYNVIKYQENAVLTRNYAKYLVVLKKNSTFARFFVKKAYH